MGSDGHSAVDDEVPHRNKRGKIVGYIVRVHSIREEECEQIQSNDYLGTKHQSHLIKSRTITETHLGNPQKTEIGLFNVESCVAVTRHEQVGSNQDTDRVVDARYFRRTKVMVDENGN